MEDFSLFVIKPQKKRSESEQEACFYPRALQDVAQGTTVSQDDGVVRQTVDKDFIKV